MAVTLRGDGVTKNNFRWSVTIGGENWGVWDTKTGGEVDTDIADPYKPGGMGPPIAMGGSVKTGNLVLNRLVTLQDDWRRLQKLINAAGKKKAVAKGIILDDDGNAYDVNPLTYNGILKRVTPPEHDSNSNDPALIEIEISIDGVPTMVG
jgi:hypothetical protein